MAGALSVVVLSFMVWERRTMFDHPGCASGRCFIIPSLHALHVAAPCCAQLTMPVLPARYNRRHSLQRGRLALAGMLPVSASSALLRRAHPNIHVGQITPGSDETVYWGEMHRCWMLESVQCCAAE